MEGRLSNLTPTMKKKATGRIFSSGGHRDLIFDKSPPWIIRLLSEEDKWTRLWVKRTKDINLF